MLRSTPQKIQNVPIFPKKVSFAQAHCILAPHYFIISSLANLAPFTRVENHSADHKCICAAILGFNRHLAMISEPPKRFPDSGG